MNRGKPNNKVRALAIMATLLFVTWGVLCGLLVVSTAMELQLLLVLRQGDQVGQYQAQLVSDRQWLLRVLFVPISLVSWIAFVAWGYYACKRAKELGPEQMSCEPRHFVIAAFFGPLGLLFINWILREIWRASSVTFSRNWWRPPVSPVLTIYLLAWLALPVVAGFFTSFLSYDAISVAEHAESQSSRPHAFNSWREDKLDAGITNAWGSIALYWITLAGCVLTAVVVLKITAMQDHKQMQMDEQADVDDAESNADQAQTDLSSLN